MSHEFVMPGKVITGKGALQDAENEFQTAGKKALIVSGKVMERVGNVKRITEILEELNIQYAIYTEITGEPTDVMIKEGAKVYKQEECDFLIGIGSNMVYRHHRYKNRYQDAIKRAGIDARYSYCGLYIYTYKSEISHSCPRA